MIIPWFIQVSVHSEVPYRFERLSDGYASSTQHYSYESDRNALTELFLQIADDRREIFARNDGEIVDIRSFPLDVVPGEGVMATIIRYGLVHVIDSSLHLTLGAGNDEACGITLAHTVIGAFVVRDRSRIVSLLSEPV